MGALAVIPARLGSTRLPRKLLLDLGGHPLVYWAWRNAAAARLVDRVLVATDSPEILRAVEGFGGEAVLTGDHPNGTSRVVAASLPHLGRHDAVLNLQADEPELSPEAIDLVLDCRRRGGLPIATLAAPLGRDRLSDRSKVKVWVDECCLGGRDGLAIDFCRVSPRSWPCDFHHVGVYAFSPEFVAAHRRIPASERSAAEGLEQLAWLDAGYEVGVAMLERGHPGGVDTPEDYAGLLSRRPGG